MPPQIRCEMNFSHAALYHGDKIFKERLTENMKRRFFLGFLLLPQVAWAHSFILGAIKIGHVWALPSDGPETSIMMPILNSGAADALIAASSPMAQSIELRDGDIKVDEFALQPNHPFPMRAVAKHLQLIGLAKPLVRGEKLQLTLTFKIAGQINLDVHISDTAGE